MRADLDRAPRTASGNLPSPSRRQLLGGAAAIAAAGTLPAIPAWSKDADAKVDVLLIGGGIMSATLGVWLKELSSAT